MQVRIIEGLLHPWEAKRAEEVLNACVHCGFCTATCPTYLQAGNELDSPRGRIYLIKEMLETGEATEVTRTHLDRCLTCLSCETTCPSGVEYHKLVAVGRTTSERLAPRTPLQKALRRVLRILMVTPGLFRVLMAIGRPFGPLMPRALRRVYFPARRGQRASPATDSLRRSVTTDPERGKVLLVRGCVQPTLRPESDAAFLRILNALGVPVEESAAASCCGAASYHTSGEEQARSLARRQVNHWWQRLSKEPIRAIVSTASGCGVHLKDYATVLADDPEYRHKAEQIAQLIRDPVEVLEQVFGDQSFQFPNRDISHEFVFHCPCTLQHGQGLTGRVERLLSRLGISLPEVEDAHLCCGSAGTYSVLQPSMSRALRAEKLENLEASRPGTILTANIGCQLHLQGGTEIPVRHWLEIVAELLEEGPRSGGIPD
ncbi:glycolate oxidase subunit GlcF [Microbulbifer guangxiensis]|uniref:glycolate oxidase subunit GlcF n=1 Tax=Microbulbifer guangxiensis TaxID=2904249 RepID=UPI001F0037E6|nr:glycolate oxidase subunit GlcF [Microbulbifer guangxiensis]